MINLPKLHFLPSPNFSKRSTPVDLLVLHDTQGGYSGAISWFASPKSKVSAHFILREDGVEAVQMVHLDDKAWHCKLISSLWHDMISIMKRTLDLPASYIRSVLNYDPETGIFRWKNTKARRVKNGDIAGSKGKRYWLINLQSIPRSAHRLAWIYIYGEVPNTIDHINGDGHDNRISNLRDCTQAQNNRNRRIDERNKSGFKGVSWHKGARRWRATIMHMGKQKHLGFYDDPALAHEAYMTAAQTAFGAFARAA